MKDISFKYVLVAIFAVAALQVFKSFLREHLGFSEYVWASASWVVLAFTLTVFLLWLKGNFIRK